MMIRSKHTTSTKIKKITNNDERGWVRTRSVRSVVVPVAVSTSAVSRPRKNGNSEDTTNWKEEKVSFLSSSSDTTVWKEGNWCWERNYDKYPVDLSSLLINYDPNNDENRKKNTIIADRYAANTVTTTTTTAAAAAVGIGVGVDHHDHTHDTDADADVDVDHHGHDQQNRQQQQPYLISEYEQLRLNKIKRNEDKLKELGLYKYTEKNKNKNSATKAKTTKRRGQGLQFLPQERRFSTRKRKSVSSTERVETFSKNDSDDTNRNNNNNNNKMRRWKTGVWTKDEYERCAQSLLPHGHLTSYEAMSDFIQTRSPTQIQRYYKKHQKSLLRDSKEYKNKNKYHHQKLHPTTSKNVTPTAQLSKNNVKYKKHDHDSYYDDWVEGSWAWLLNNDNDSDNNAGDEDGSHNQNRQRKRQWQRAIAKEEDEEEENAAAAAVSIISSEDKQTRYQNLSSSTRKKMNPREQHYQEAWEIMYQQLVTYQQQQGHTMVPRIRNTPHNSQHTIQVKALGRWVSRMRSLQANQKLPWQRYQLLQAIDFEWHTTSKSKRNKEKELNNNV